MAGQEKRKLSDDAQSKETEDCSDVEGKPKKKLKPEDGPSGSTAKAKSIQVEWKKITSENLDLDYSIFYQKAEADELMSRLERDLVFNTGKEAQVLVYGKWHDIPRKQAAYGDKGLSYRFSGKTVPAKPWIPPLLEIRDRILGATGHKFNFVLVNRYKDGSDHTGEHRDEEKELVPESPIASVSLGQPRDFVFRHADTRGRSRTRHIDNVALRLEHGSLLMMNYPTNHYWYHALPPRKNVTGVRLNLTFRDFVVKKQGKTDKA